MKRPYKVRGREEGRGKPWTTSFATLASASLYIQSHWQGTEYKDGDKRFHSDFATFELVGFTFSEIGYYAAPEDPESNWREFKFGAKPEGEVIVRCEGPRYDNRDGICGTWVSRHRFTTREAAEAYVEECWAGGDERAWIELTPAEVAAQEAARAAEEAERVARELADPIPF